MGEHARLLRRYGRQLVRVFTEGLGPGRSDQGDEGVARHVGGIDARDDRQAGVRRRGGWHQVRRGVQREPRGAQDGESHFHSFSYGQLE